MGQVPETTIAELFSLRANQSPDLIAVIGERETLSYRQLDEQSDSLAFFLQQRGVGPEHAVGVALERTPALLVSLLAILKAGAAYVPVDPKYPKERIAWIMDDSGMQLLLTSGAVEKVLPLEGRKVETVDVERFSFEESKEERPRLLATDANLAYVIYTSGSTGRPKGVMIENRNVTNFFAGMDRAIGSGPGIWLAITSICFDISVLELLWTLTRGFTIVLHGENHPDSISGAMIRHRVSHLQLTPSHARILLLDSQSGRALSGIKQLLLGGESVPASLVQDIRKVFAGDIYNMYGPTETTVWSTSGLIAADPGKSVSIGKPILNTQIHLLNESLECVAQGEVGEVFIGGAGVARGYWNRPDLTNERFLMIPNVAPERLYRTGDLGRELPGGNLECLGRTDFQVKLRGYRIELGEIESLLEKQSRIQQAVVVLRGANEEDKRLVAYLVASGQAPTARELRTALESSLPEYMVPTQFVFLPKLPLTANGKTDRKALLSLTVPPIREGSAVVTEMKAAEGIEETLRGWFQELLGVSPVSLDDDFFQLGGHSLTGLRLFSRVHGTFQLQMELASLFDLRTVRKLASAIKRAQEEVPYPKSRASCLVPINSSGTRPPLFLIHAVGGDVLFYEPVANALGSDRPIYAFRSPMSFKGEMQQKTVAEQAEVFVNELRSFYSDGPFFLAGHSYGGVLAFEMAQQLQALGVGPELLILIDAVLPGSTKQVPVRAQLRTLIDNLRNNGLPYLRRKGELKFRYISESVAHELQLAASFAIRTTGGRLPLTLRYAQMEEIHLRALQRYKPRPYSGSVSLIRAIERGPESLSEKDDPVLGWSEFVRRDLDIQDVEAGHFDMLLGPHAREVAKKINLMISHAESRSQQAQPVA